MTKGELGWSLAWQGLYRRTQPLEACKDSALSPTCALATTHIHLALICAATLYIYMLAGLDDPRHLHGNFVHVDHLFPEGLQAGKSSVPDPGLCAVPALACEVQHGGQHKVVEALAGAIDDLQAGVPVSSRTPGMQLSEVPWLRWVRWCWLIS